jgi:hypothetical protein
MQEERGSGVMADQIKTRKISIKSIMRDPKFTLGVADARAGKPFPPDYDSWRDDRWAYERGRQWAALAPRNVRLKHNGKITEIAHSWFLRHGDDIL